ncbi:hypothetical protein [Aureimonas phyllosphaerae]|uniref:Uncharacterized protein n=1 Tax=Aureimonas phyllosphaerae TaxID=1166078 RepID=A0A7W6C456_9HYPH|nr:hypothetical protein [Aureimonas phyllosphaerae]MBB3938112.1 hypothetical protein [Aureimonas phyllosphaerae]MBB3962119.1 hypothetical protein [Aureimonas phyllosphaerae]
MTPETRDARWRMLRDLNLTAHDELLISLVASGRMEELVTQFARSASSIDALPETVAAAVRSASREVLGPVTKAATEQVKAAHATLAASTGHEVASSATAYLDREFQRRRFTVSAGVLLVGVLVMLLVGYVGHSLGARSSISTNTTIAAIANRPDTQTVLSLLAANPDLKASIGTWCGSGTGRVTVVEGVRNCSLPLWIDGRSAAPAQTPNAGPLVSMWNAGASFLNRFSGPTIAFAFLILGVLLRKIILTVGKAPGVKWLTT